MCLDGFKTFAALGRRFENIATGIEDNKVRSIGPRVTESGNNIVVTYSISPDVIIQPSHSSWNQIVPSIVGVCHAMPEIVEETDCVFSSPVNFLRVSINSAKYLLATDICNNRNLIVCKVNVNQRFRDQPDIVDWISQLTNLFRRSFIAD